MKKTIRITIIISVAYFIVWLLQLIVWALITPADQKQMTVLPAFLSVQFWPMIAVWVVVGIVSAIYWRKHIAQEIKTFINE